METLSHIVRGMLTAITIAAGVYVGLAAYDFMNSGSNGGTGSAQ